MFAPVSFIEILDLVGTTATVLALLFAIKSFQKNVRINEARFIQDHYRDFRASRQAILDNPQELRIQARELGISPESLIKDSLGSFGINKAREIYALYKRNLLPQSQWESDVEDMKVLFSNTLIAERWQQLRMRHPKDFQAFIDTHILSTQTEKQKTNETSNSPHHRQLR